MVHTIPMLIVVTVLLPLLPLLPPLLTSSRITRPLNLTSSGSSMALQANEQPLLWGDALSRS